MSSGNNINTVIGTVATVLIAQTLWSFFTPPKWVKQRFSRGDAKNQKDANDDLCSVTTICAKLKDVLTKTHAICGDVIPDDMPYFKLYCCFMSMIDLMNEMCLNYPEFREKQFADGSNERSVEITEDDLKDLLPYLDFADWAYLDCLIDVQLKIHPLGYQLIRFDVVTEPGRAGHFIAVHHDKKEIVIAVKGTSTFSDILTDAIGKIVPQILDDQTKMRCHEGINIATKMVFEETLHLLENFFIPQNYKVVICGHSLGAGISSLLGMFIKHRAPSCQLQVYAFATPACCSYERSLQCSEYITSVVNNNDCVPRMSLNNLQLMCKLFIKIESKLEEKGLIPKDLRSAKRFFEEVVTVDSDVLISPHELTQFFDKELAEESTSDEGQESNIQEVALFVPGKIVSVWNDTKDQSIINGKITNCKSHALRQLFIESNMLSDHSCSTYRKNLVQLLEKTTNTF